jgi:hypothetical protein
MFSGRYPIPYSTFYIHHSIFAIHHFLSFSPQTAPFKRFTQLFSFTFANCPFLKWCGATVLPKSEISTRQLQIIHGIIAPG